MRCSIRGREFKVPFFYGAQAVGASASSEISHMCKRNLVPRVLSIPPSRKYPGCGWSRAYLYKSNPQRGWAFYLILSTLSMEVTVALPYRRYFETLFQS